MRKLGLISAMALLVSAGNALAYTAALSVGGNGGIVLLPLGGGTFDVAIDLSRGGGENDAIIGFQTDFVASAPGITINSYVGPSGSAGNAGTGTRYNDPEWDSNTTGSGGASNPNTSLAGPMAAGVPKQSMGTLYAANGGLWTTGSSRFGFLNITVAPQSFDTIITLATTNSIGPDDQFGEHEFAADGVTFQYVPEPASALLLLAAVPFMRRRRTA